MSPLAHANCKEFQSSNGKDWSAFDRFVAYSIKVLVSIGETNNLIIEFNCQRDFAVLITYTHQRLKHYWSIVMSLSKLVVYVTGAGQGLGRATAHRLAAHGARVVVADRSEAAARAVSLIDTIYDIKIKKKMFRWWMKSVARPCYQ